MKRKPTGVRSIGIDRDAQALEAFACDYPVELVHGCAHAFLASFPFLGPELVYSDPPYLHATRRSARRYRFDVTVRLCRDGRSIADAHRLGRLFRQGRFSIDLEFASSPF